MLVPTSDGDDPSEVLVLSLLLAPVVIVVAAFVERRLGPSAAGWAGALPVAFCLALVAVSADAGTASGTALALSAATHVPAQVAFGVVFAKVLVRRGLVLGILGGSAAYALGSVLVVHVPAPVALGLAVAALALAPRLMPQGRPGPGSGARWTTTVLSGIAAASIVAAAVLSSRLAGPELAGAVAAFPTISTTIVVLVVRRDGRSAGAHTLGGLVRSLPCYLSFCLVAVLAAPGLGLVAVPLALLAALAAAGVTWRTVPVVRRPAGAEAA